MPLPALQNWSSPKDLNLKASLLPSSCEQQISDVIVANTFLTLPVPLRSHTPHSDREGIEPQACWHLDLIDAGES